jgi:hypothetical protein
VAPWALLGPDVVRFSTMPACLLPCSACWDSFKDSHVERIERSWCGTRGKSQRSLLALLRPSKASAAVAMRPTGRAATRMTNVELAQRVLALVAESGTSYGCWGERLGR